VKSIRPYLFLVVAIITTTGPSTATGTDTGSETRAVANNTRFFFFNMQSLGEYDVRKNATLLPKANATGAGVIDFQEIVDAGDQIIISLTGIGTQPPIPPQGVQARETSPGCVTVTWQGNPEPDINGYVVHYGPQSVSQGQVANYATSVVVGNVTSHEICGFSPGTQYFAVTAYNTGDESSGYSSERAVDIIGSDTDPPAISSVAPQDGAVGVPLDTRVAFTIFDSQSGVDSNSVDVTINGNPPDRVTFSGSPATYIVVCEVTGGFAPQTAVDVSVQASDLATPANAMSYSWSFTTGSNVDTSPPTFCCLTPANGASGVDPYASISFGVSDAGAGVDLAGINFTVNGQSVLYDVSGDPQDAVVTFSNTLGLAPGSTVQVSVSACDLSSSANCASLDYTFTIATAGAALADGAVIFPDGYFADDPNRPLEVRNIPLGWTVRVFSVAGEEVLSFKNPFGDGHTWSWDFTNDSGHQVARGLYLIRVFNEGGDLERSGRFVVQRDR
jgi:hypothetical protein